MDAHQPGVRLGSRVLSPMPHERWPGLLHTEVLLPAPPTGDLAPDRATFHEALREGRCFLALSALGSAREFRFWAEDGERAVAMGGAAPAGRWTLRARLPAAARVRLVHDGTPVKEADADRLEHAVTEPGVYRLEAWLTRGGRERAWILSNPVYLRGSTTRAG